MNLLEPALALTIHRAQGSEADAVTVLGPQGLGLDNAYERSLLYTAMTRARQLDSDQRGRCLMRIERPGAGMTSQRQRYKVKGF